MPEKPGRRLIPPKTGSAANCGGMRGAAAEELIRISAITAEETFCISSADRRKPTEFIKNIEKIIKEDV